MNTLTGQVPKVSVFISVNGFGQVTRALRVAAGGCEQMRAGRGAGGL